MADTKILKSWSSLAKSEQLFLQEAYQAELDKQPLTCSLDEKVSRFAHWLAEQGVSFTAADLRKKR